MTEHNKKTATMVAGVAGAVVGAGVAVAATKVMSDKKLRDQVTGTISDLKNQVVGILDEAQHSDQLNQKGGSASRQLGSNSQGKGKSGAGSKSQEFKGSSRTSDKAM